MEKVALLVIYNHRYDKNIPMVDKLYKNKFSHVYHLVPFYDGNKANVIPVYESSFYFQSYIAQAYTHLRGRGFSHYFIVADDMLLNPLLTEDNLWDVTGLRKDECFITELIDMQKKKEAWPRVYDAIMWNFNVRGVEVKKILPNIDNAMIKMGNKGFYFSPLTYKQVWKNYVKFKNKFYEIFKLKRKFDYPIIGGYSDILLVTEACMQKFCSYCGAFAAVKLFVEMAIPTSLVLASDKIRTCDSIKLKSGAMWSGQQKAFLNAFNYNLQELKGNYPSDKLFLHPIKLSKWK